MARHALLDKIIWYAHSSFLIKASQNIYFDPWKLPDGQPMADLILITHPHPDHFSLDDIKKISGPNTRVIAHPGCVGIPGDVEYVKPGEKIMIGAVVVDVIPAYNVDKFRSPGVPFHPKESQFNGYVVRVDDARVYFAGDTDIIVEMKDLGTIDIGFFPISGTYVMTVDEAVRAARLIKPQVAIPMHHGSIVGTLADGERFASELGEMGHTLKQHK